jgi:hypothetical protein
MLGRVAERDAQEVPHLEAVLLQRSDPSSAANMMATASGSRSATRRICVPKGTPPSVTTDAI